MGSATLGTLPFQVFREEKCMAVEKKNWPTFSQTIMEAFRYKLEPQKRCRLEYEKSDANHTSQTTRKKTKSIKLFRIKNIGSLIVRSQLSSADHIYAPHIG